MTKDEKRFAWKMLAMGIGIGLLFVLYFFETNRAAIPTNAAAPDAKAYCCIKINNAKH